MSYYKSEHVDVFPSTYRVKYPQGKFTSEQNFVNILNSLTDVKNYVLGYDGNTLKVVLNGYYFEVDSLSKPEDDDLYLGIKVEKGGYSLVNYASGSIKSTVLDNDNEEFTGLFYSTDPINDESNDNYNCYYLQVFSKGNLVNTVRLTTDSIKYNSLSNLTDELDAKQYILTSGTGVEELDNNDASKRKVQLSSDVLTKLDAMPNKGSDGRKLMYTNSSGELINASEDLDIGDNAVTKGSALESQCVYVLNGSIVAGQTFFASKQNPSGGKVGDIWFKYN